MPGGDEGRAGGTEPLVVTLDLHSVLVFLGAVATLVVITGVARSIPKTLAALAIAILLALALNPAVVAVQRRLGVRRGVATAVVLGGLFGVLALVVTLLVPPAVRQARDLGDELPHVIEDLGRTPVIGEQLRKNKVPEKVDTWVRKLPERLSGDTTPLEDAGRSAFDGAVAALLTLLLAVTLLVDGERLLRAARRLVPPERAEIATRLANLAYEVVGHYVAGSLLVAGIAGVCTLVAGLVLGVPLTPLAAVNVALWDLVPQVGGAAGGAPFVLLAVTDSPGTGVAALVFFIVYLNIENHLLQPLLVGNAVKLSPPATMCAALLGVSAGGAVGALLAVPLTGAAKAIYLELRRVRAERLAEAAGAPPPAAAT